VFLNSCFSLYLYVANIQCVREGPRDLTAGDSSYIILYVNPFRSLIVFVHYLMLIRPILVKKHCILICVCGPVLGLGLYKDVPYMCSAGDDCCIYMSDRERELYYLCSIVVRALRKGRYNCSFPGWAWLGIVKAHVA